MRVGRRRARGGSSWPLKRLMARPNSARGKSLHFERAPASAAPPPPVAAPAAASRAEPSPSDTSRLAALGHYRMGRCALVLFV